MVEVVDVYPISAANFISGCARRPRKPITLSKVVHACGTQCCTRLKLYE